MIDPATTERLRALYQDLIEEPLWPDDHRYFDIFAEPGMAALDPVARLAAFDQLAFACDGYLRDLFRMLGDLTAHAGTGSRQRGCTRVAEMLQSRRAMFAAETTPQRSASGGSRPRRPPEPS